MNADSNNKNFDDLICRAIGRDKPKFDFNKWKQAHQEEIEIFRSQTADRQITRSILPFYIWRIIMKNKVSKIAAAAAIIIVVTMILHNGSIDIARPAFGLDDITAAMQKAEWVHCTMTLEELSGDTDASPIGIGKGWESWESINPSLFIEKQSNGKIYFREKDLAKTSTYDPESNIVTVEYKSPSASQETFTSLTDMYLKQLAGVEKNGDKVKLKADKVVLKEDIYQGQPVKNIDIYVTSEGGLQSIISLIVDTETSLPKKMSVRQTSIKGNITGKMTGIFDYLNTSPKDIYEAGAPRDAQVIRIEAVNDRDNRELIEVLKPYNTARENLISDYILITYEHGSSLRRIFVTYNQGRKQRSEHHPFWGWAVTNDDLIAFKKALGDDFESLLMWSQDYGNSKSKNLGIYIYDGEYYYSAEKSPLDKWTIDEKKHWPDTNPVPLEDLSDWGWPNIPNKNNVRQIENDYSKENDLIAFEIILEPNISNGKLYHSAQKAIYYLDPSRDYMCVRKEEFHHMIRSSIETKDVDFDLNEIPDELSSVRFVSEFGLTENGQWYPKKIEKHSKSLDLNGNEKPLSLSCIYTLYLETNPVFPEGIFDPNNLPK